MNTEFTTDLKTEIKEENPLEQLAQKLQASKNAIEKSDWLIEACAAKKANMEALKALIQTHVPPTGPCLLQQALLQNEPNPTAIHFILQHNLGSDLLALLPDGNTIFSSAIKSLNEKLTSGQSSQALKLLLIDTLEILLIQVFISNNQFNVVALNPISALSHIEYGKDKTIGAKLFSFYIATNTTALGLLINMCKEMETTRQFVHPFAAKEIAAIKRQALILRGKNLSGTAVLQDGYKSLQHYFDLNNPVEAWNRVGASPYYKGLLKDLSAIHDDYIGPLAPEFKKEARNILQTQLLKSAKFTSVETSDKTTRLDNPEAFSDDATLCTGGGFVAMARAHAQIGLPNIALQARFFRPSDSDILARTGFSILNALLAHITIRPLVDIIMNYIPSLIIGIEHSNKDTYFFVIEKTREIKQDTEQDLYNLVEQNPPRIGL